MLLVSIPAPRMSTMTSTVRPRRSSSCLILGGRGAAAAAVSPRPGPGACRSRFRSSQLRAGDEMMLTWDSLRAVLTSSKQTGERGHVSVPCTDKFLEGMRCKGNMKAAFIYHGFSLPALLSFLRPGLLLSPLPARAQLWHLFVNAYQHIL